MRPKVYNATPIVLNTAIAAVWLINGLVCKVLNLVPRHREIVAHILGAGHAATLTILIGILEVSMGIWILTNYKSRLCTILQVIVVATMNIIEFFCVPDMLLFGRVNALVATGFIIIVLANEFLLKAHPARKRTNLE